MGYEVLTSKGEKIILAEPFSSGGEGEVRNIVNPAHYSNNCVKIYKQEKRTKERADKIRFMVDNPPTQIHSNGFMIGWPLETIHHLNKEFVGFMMPLAFTDSIQLSYLTVPKLNMKKLSNDWQKYARENGTTALINRLKLMFNIAIPIHLLHQTEKYVLKDFKPQNMLATNSGKITIVDMDSIQIIRGHQLLFHGTAATPEYIPPEFYNKGVGKSVSVPLEKSWDYFALSVVFYQLLFGLHPYVVTPKKLKDENSNEISTNIADDLFPFGSNAYKIKGYPPLHNKFSILPQNLQNLFIRSFSLYSNQRPSAEMWGRSIQEVISQKPTTSPPIPVCSFKEIKYCSVCGREYYTIQSKFCDKCGHKRT